MKRKKQQDSRKKRGGSRKKEDLGAKETGVSLPRPRLEPTALATSRRLGRGAGERFWPLGYRRPLGEEGLRLAPRAERPLGRSGAELCK